MTMGGDEDENRRENTAKDETISTETTPPASCSVHAMQAEGYAIHFQESWSLSTVIGKKLLLT